MAVKSMFTVQNEVTRHLKKAGEHIYPDKPQPARVNRSGTDILTDLYSRADNLMQEIDASQESISRKAEAYLKVEKLVSRALKSERTAHVRIADKSLEEMDARELEALVQEALRVNSRKTGGGGVASKSGITGKSQSRFPLQRGSRPVNTNSAAQIENSEENLDSVTPQKNRKQQERAFKSAAARKNKKSTVPKRAQQETPPLEATPEAIDDVLDEIRGLL